MSGFAADAPKPAPQSAGPTVMVSRADEAKFPEITVDFLITNADGKPLLDANRADIHVFESDREMSVLSFESPLSTELRPTTLVLVVDRSGSMREDDKMAGLRRAVGTFVQGLPKGSKVAVVGFSDRVDTVCPFTSDFTYVQAAVDELTPQGPTRFYDAVAVALEMLEGESGRRGVLALTDGMDTFSQNANIESVVTLARRLGLPVHTLGLGSGEDLSDAALRGIAEATRGRYYPARKADELKSIYEEIARSLKDTYSLTYRTEHRLPDGTLRPISVSYRLSRNVGKAEVFIRGMVVPAGGWSGLFLILLVGLSVLAVVPRIMRRGAT